MKRIVKKIMRWWHSVVILGIILYLTLSPDPMSGHKVQLFEGADKVVHCCMFMALSAAMVYDLTRDKCPRRLLIGECLVLGLICVAIGGMDEIAQGCWVEGRSGDILDFVADIVGIIIGVVGAHLWFKRALSND
ncbi:MAG: VanZ family protein [Lepagella sp.]